jgi:hypothetical protein
MSVHPQLQDDDSNAPDVAHIMVMTAPTKALAIQPGDRLMIVEGPEAHKKFPFVLVSVSHKKIVLQLGNTNYTYKLLEGKPLTLKALQRMKENRTPN